MPVDEKATQSSHLGVGREVSTRDLFLRAMYSRFLDMYVYVYMYKYVYIYMYIQMYICVYIHIVRLLGIPVKLRYRTGNPCVIAHITLNPRLEPESNPKSTTVSPKPKKREICGKTLKPKHINRKTLILKPENLRNLKVMLCDVG